MIRIQKSLVAFLKACFLPPGSLILGGFAGSLLAASGRAGWGLGISAVSLGLLWILGIPQIARRLLGLFDRHPPVQEGAAGAYDLQAVVVLDAGGRDGARENPGMGVSALTLERLRYGAFLYHQWGLPVLVTGNGAGRAQGDVLEEAFQVPVRWVEALSNTTQENALFSAHILLPQGISRIALVTHFWHMPRAALAFQRAGFLVTTAAMGFGGESRGVRAYLPSLGGWLSSYLALHELIGGAWYRLRFRPRGNSKNPSDPEKERKK
ncbi:MAG: YdcF family protein [Deltaproteobacteria bacterium]|nr:YdcF family protein [Deltaproteobacteria bacterium]